MNKMKGWKTVTGSIMIGAGYVCISVLNEQEIGNALIAVGTSLTGIGIAGKLNKMGG